VPPYGGLRHVAETDAEVDDALDGPGELVTPVAVFPQLAHSETKARVRVDSSPPSRIRELRRTDSGVWASTSVCLGCGKGLMPNEREIGVCDAHRRAEAIPVTASR